MSERVAPLSGGDDNSGQNGGREGRERSNSLPRSASVPRGASFTIAPDVEPVAAELEGGALARTQSAGVGHSQSARGARGERGEEEGRGGDIEMVSVSRSADRPHSPVSPASQPSVVSQSVVSAAHVIPVTHSEGSERRGGRGSPTVSDASVSVNPVPSAVSASVGEGVMDGDAVVAGAVSARRPSVPGEVEVGGGAGAGQGVPAGGPAFVRRARAAVQQMRERRRTMRSRRCKAISYGGLQLGIFAIVLFALSFFTVDALHVGIVINTWTQEVYGDVLRPGRYFLSIFASVVQHPTTQHLVSFSDETNAANMSSSDVPATPRPSLTVFTNEGLSVEVDVIVYYRLSLHDDNVIAFYQAYKGKYANLLADRMKSAINNALSGYSVSYFIEQRRVLSEAVAAALQAEASEDGFFVIVDALLADVRLPTEVETSQVQKITEIQLSRLASVRRQVRMVEAESRVLVAKADKEIAVVDADYSSWGTRLEEEWKARGKAAYTISEGRAYAATAKYLSMSISDTIMYSFQKEMLAGYIPNCEFVGVKPKNGTKPEVTPQP
uniref:Band 7 domain-containing protein n=1 Tax=Palpitomonas bilix TaxID=652834 RepID=A0A7S3D074_9EUKA|mmetsp:Transcript_16175/g.40916  ORF Transcript_16175/g.40916 Transcript_16175/m.40916 type:complete len:554 (+) Transcript_16175:105-1766(+)